MIEFRIGWSASSNASFHSTSDWEPWGGDEDATAEDVEAALGEPEGPGSINIPLGLEMMLDLAGIEWWVETRTVESGTQEEA